MDTSQSAVRKLPRGTLKKLTLGQSFAEYDKLLEKDNVYVETPALRAAVDGGQGKCFFVGRRGTGKTAITLYLERKFPGNVMLLLPQLLVPIGRYFDDVEIMQNVHHQPFKSLVASFKRAMLDQVLRYWIQRGKFSYRANTPPNLSRERNYVEDYDFDLSLLSFAEDMLESLDKSQDKEWLRSINRSKEIAQAMDALMGGLAERTLLLIDRVDEAWDGSDKSVILLMAMMHACVELSSTCDCLRPMLFLRENVFERVKSIDREFARLETFVTSLEWTREQLLELVERRLNAPLIAKYALRGETWRAFFEDGALETAQDLVFNYCQYRPRDVLSYCAFAIEIAQSRLSSDLKATHVRREFMALRSYVRFLNRSPSTHSSSNCSASALASNSSPCRIISLQNGNSSDLRSFRQIRASASISVPLAAHISDFTICSCFGSTFAISLSPCGVKLMRLTFRPCLGRPRRAFGSRVSCTFAAGSLDTSCRTQPNSFARRIVSCRFCRTRPSFPAASVTVRGPSR